MAYHGRCITSQPIAERNVHCCSDRSNNNSKIGSVIDCRGPKDYETLCTVNGPVHIRLVKADETSGNKTCEETPESKKPTATPKCCPTIPLANDSFMFSTAGLKHSEEDGAKKESSSPTEGVADEIILMNPPDGVECMEIEMLGEDSTLTVLMEESGDKQAPGTVSSCVCAKCCQSVNKKGPIPLVSLHLVPIEELPSGISTETGDTVSECHKVKIETQKITPVNDNPAAVPTKTGGNVTEHLNHDIKKDVTHKLAPVIKEQPAQLKPLTVSSQPTEINVIKEQPAELKPLMVNGQRTGIQIQIETRPDGTVTECLNWGYKNDHDVTLNKAPQRHLERRQIQTETQPDGVVTECLNLGYENDISLNKTPQRRPIQKQTQPGGTVSECLNWGYKNILEAGGDMGVHDITSNKTPQMEQRPAITLNKAPQMEQRPAGIPTRRSSGSVADCLMYLPSVDTTPKKS